jgi:DNA-binding FrmR family transcriptional regulator/protein-L-isoaspartate O-methyltransferase
VLPGIVRIGIRNAEKVLVDRMDKEHVFFENYADTWDRDRKENREILAYMMRLSELPPGAHVLDAGCGTGTLIPYLHEAVGEQGMVEAFDYSRQMLDKAREKFSHLREVVFTEGNILKYDFPDQCYDAVICLNVYPHMAGRARDFIRKMYGTLKRQGSLIIMHDMPRQCVNRLRGDSAEEPPCLLPPVDILESQLIGCGFSVAIAMDTAQFYFIKVIKDQELPYAQYVDEDTELPAVSQIHTGGHVPHRHNHTQTKMVMNRLARISGHLEAIKRMVDEGRDCSEVLMQLAAVDSAIVSVSKVVLKDHIDHCIVDAVRENNVEAIENLKKSISTFIK